MERGEGRKILANGRKIDKGEHRNKESEHSVVSEIIKKIKNLSYLRLRGGVQIINKYKFHQ